MTEQVIYENPAAPLPEWARWMAKSDTDCAWVYDWKPNVEPTGFGSLGRDTTAPEYSIDGHWATSLRRIIRLSEPQYYVPENPHTDDEGFLPHDGGVMPEWLSGKDVQIKTASGRVAQLAAMSRLCWEWEDARDPDYCIVAYKIVGDGSKSPRCTFCETTKNLRQAHDGGGFVDPEYICEACFTPRDDGPCFDDLPAVGDGSEDREAGDILPRKNPALYRREEVAQRLHSASGDPARLIQILSTEYIRLRALEEVLYDYDSIRAHMDPESMTRSVHISDTIHAIQSAWADAILDQENDQ